MYKGFAFGASSVRTLRGSAVGPARTCGVQVWICAKKTGKIAYKIANAEKNIPKISMFCQIDGVFEKFIEKMQKIFAWNGGRKTAKPVGRSGRQKFAGMMVLSPQIQVM